MRISDWSSDVCSSDLLLFGSELKSLLKAPDCPRQIDADALRAYFTYGYVPCPLSIFSGINKLPPAHLLRYRDGKISLQRYWPASLAPKTTLGEAAAEDALAGHLQRAVSSRLVADVPIGSPEARSVGKAGDSTCSARWSPYQ